MLGPAATRANAALAGLAVLRPWCAFLKLADQVSMLPLLQLEYRFRLLRQEEGLIDAVVSPLAALDPDEVAAVGATLPGQIATLATDFDRFVGTIEDAGATQHKVMIFTTAVDLLTFAVSLKGMFNLRGPPAALSIPMFAGMRGGVATMTRIVVSAEVIEAIRHLVAIGALTAAGAAQALQVQGVTSAMAQAGDLPQAVVDLIGEGPTVDAMKVTNATGAGTARAPRHHVLPQAERPFFEQRGFTGDLDIDNFTVTLETAEHQAQHGGGNWRLGRTWIEEWNSRVMLNLRMREAVVRRRLSVAEVLDMVVNLMRTRGIPPRFIPYRGGG